MAKISQLPAAESIQGTDILPVVTGSVTKKISKNNFLGYKSYVAKLEQIGTAAPTATILQNTFAETLTWVRSDVGIYTLEAAGGVFPNNKTYVSITNPNQIVDGTSTRYTSEVVSGDLIISGVTIRTYSGTTLTDGILGSDGANILEIRVYN